MPIQRCKSKGKRGYKWGNQKCYTGITGKAKALRQARAIRASGWTGNVFCPTGEGGGIDPTCGKGGGSGGWTDSDGMALPGSPAAIYSTGEFLNINQTMRNGGGDESTREIAGNLIRQIDDAPKLGKQEVYRGLLIPKDEIPKVGSTVREKGFMSASTDPKIARKFAEGFTGMGDEEEGVPVRFRIKVPGGTKGVRHLARGEEEVIFQAGSSLKIENVVKFPGGEYRVLASISSPKSKVIVTNQSRIITNAASPLRADPTRTATLRRKFAEDLRRRLNFIAKQIREVVEVEDAFGLRQPNPITFNVFCPTGKGGGIDPTCGKGGVHGIPSAIEEIRESKKDDPKKIARALYISKRISVSEDNVRDYLEGKNPFGSPVEDAKSKTKPQVSKEQLDEDLQNWFDFDSASAVKAASAGEDLAEFTTSGGEYLTKGEQSSYKKAAARIQSVAEKSNSGHSTLYRGQAVTDEEFSTLKTGGTYEFKSLTAAAVDKNIADIYADKEQFLFGEGQNVIFSIKDPGGIKGLEIPKGINHPGGEVIIPRGEKYKISSVKEHPDGYHSVSLIKHTVENSEPKVSNQLILNEKYGALMLMIDDKEVVDEIEAIQKQIDPNDLEELEKDTHITIRYGFTGEVNPEQIEQLVQQHSPNVVEVKELSLFQNDVDVLKFDIDSPALQSFYAHLGIIPNVVTHPDYHPHLTVAYLKQGTGYKYLHLGDRLIGRKIESRSLVYSTPDREWTRMELVSNQRWKFRTSPEQLKAFLAWLKELTGRIFLGSGGEEQDQYWQQYVEEGFKKGAGRAFDDVKKPAVQDKLDFYDGTKEQFLKSSFGQPESVNKVKLLAGRVFTDLQGVTQDMSTKMSRTLTDGLVQGQNPRTIARALVADLNFSQTRAETIARTEIIRAHAEGALQSLEELGVEEIGVMVEWDTAGDGRVCPKCQELDGVVLKIEEAHGLLPRHPQCRCAFLPANLGEPSEGQKRTKARIESAIQRSVKLDGKKSTWTGQDRTVSKKRPESLIDNNGVTNVFCPTGKGGGIDPTCSKGGSSGWGTADNPIALDSLARLLTEHKPSEFTPGMYVNPEGYATSQRYSGVADAGPVTAKVYRVGELDHKRSGGVFFGGDEESLAPYTSLHEGHEVKAYTAALQSVVVAGHQNDLTKKWFNKPYGRMMDEFHSRYGKLGADEATARFDKKLFTEAKKRGYDGIVYMNPAPPAETELAVIGDARKKLVGTTKSITNVFCPTGKGGGIDPTCGKGGVRVGGGGTSAIKDESVTPPPPGEHYSPNVELDPNGDGVTDASRVGVPHDSVPPPPPIGRLPNLTDHERAVESAFIGAYEKNPDGMAADYRRVIDLNTKPGEPPTFGTDDAKVLADAWSVDDLGERSQNRATLNVALHQTANSIAKRAFVQELDGLKPGDEILVTVGGCGAGKGYALKNVPEALVMKQRAKVVWDSAGDQNATENPWIQKEAERRGLKVSYAFVHADPKTQWAHPERGVVKRAGDPNDGRMVDAKVFADSYALGARNHQAFYEANKNNQNASFVFMDNSGKPKLLDGIPKEALSVDRLELARFAADAVNKIDTPPHVRRGALIGERIWSSGT